MARETKVNYEQIIPKLLKAAEKGDVKAQYNLGVLYHTGKGVDKDYAQAALWYRKAAEQGNGKAQFYLGNLYQSGKAPGAGQEAVFVVKL